MLRQPPTPVRPLLITVLACLAFYYAFFVADEPRRQPIEFPPSRDGYSHRSERERHGRPVFDNLSLSEEECRDTFPGLMDEIDRAVANGPFRLKPRTAKGPLIAAIRDGGLWILEEPGRGELSQQMKERQLAALHQLHRALITSPRPLPPTTLSLSVADSPIPNSLTYARPSTDPSSTKRHTFPAPHFAFWTWTSPFLSSLPRAHRAVEALESTLSWPRKDPRAVWRGTTWFSNGAGANPRLRQDLVRTAANQSWADVEALRWETNGASAGNGLDIAEFCRYRYIIHTEGVSYSGRLNFHLLCRSVILTPPIEWMERTTHLVKPVYSTVLLGSGGGGGSGTQDGASENGRYPSRRAREAWPVKYGAEEANMVFVAPDWSDLEETIAWLEEHPRVAEGIATRQRELFVGRGYLSPAAETCYWRSLIKGWSEVVQYDGSDWDEGVSFEEYVLKQGRQ